MQLKYSYDEYYQIFSNLISRVGVNADLLGYHYMAFICAKIMTYSGSLTRTMKRLKMKTVYQMTAVKYETTWESVDGCIRYAIKKVFSQGNCDLLEEIFGFMISPETGVTKNKVFIYGLCNYINNYSEEI